MTNAREFTLRLQDLLSRERVAMAEFLVALAEFDAGALYIDLGYASLFDYLHRELGISKASAFLRAAAARLIRKYPEVVEPLRDGRLCLSTMGELSRTITPETREVVLPRFFHLSKREAKAVAAAIRPDEAPPRREVVTVVRPPVEAPRLDLAVPRDPAAPTSERPLSLSVVRPDEPSPAAALPTAVSALPARQLAAPPSAVEPLTADLVRIHVTADKRFADKLEKAKDALSHSLPGAGVAQILEAGLDALLERHMKRKGLVTRPLATPRPSADPGRIPAHVRREVWKRDGGRCQWRLASGGICGSTYRAEVDHATPRALGGRATVEGCRVLCKPHNLQAARELFGDECMDLFTTNPPRRFARERRDAPDPAPLTPASGGRRGPTRAGSTHRPAGRVDRHGAVYAGAA